MSTPMITEEEQLALRNRAKAELERLEIRLAEKEKIQIVDEFKNKFNICETVYKIILEEHQKSKGKKIEKQSLSLTMKQVPYALKFAGYTFEKDLLTELFGASSPTGKSTAKKLRNETTHGISKKAVEEIVSRKDELFGYMDSFLSVIRTQDLN